MVSTAPLDVVVESPPTAAPAAAAHRIGALDGVRAVAVLAVVVYHLWPDRLPGGFLGVDVFMVLSGYLITGILVRERARSGRVRLGAFWGRRFRRLVPALVFLLACVALFLRAFGPSTLVAPVRSQGLAALAYVANWKLIADSVSYGASFGPVSPLLHLWSLSIEEQFYVVWPLLLVGLLAFGGRRWAVRAAVVGAVASAVWMAVRFVPGDDPLRLYFGTDTRAQAFLVGAVAALVAPVVVGRVLAWLGGLALAGVGVLFLVDSPGFLYRGGFLVVAVVSALLVVAAGSPSRRGPVPWLLDRGPLRVLGRVSYGVYLWHWPAIVLLDSSRTGLRGGWLVVVRLAATAVGTTVSWFLIERPFARWRPRRIALGGAVAVAASFACLFTLPSVPVVAYAGVRVDRVPPPVVAEPSPSAAVVPAGTVMIVGDSGMYDAAPPLRAGFVAAGWRVVEAAYPGVGVTHPGPEVRRQWADTVRAQGVTLTVVMLGAWDLGYPKDHGDDAYRAALDDAVAAFTADGGRVLWLAMLPGGTTPGRAVDRFFAELPGRYPGSVTYYDPEGAFRGPDGDWPRSVDGVLLRKPDDWHLCPEGALVLARWVLLRVGVLPPAGWQTGDWRADVRYDDPPGGCRAP